MVREDYVDLYSVSIVQRVKQYGKSAAVSSSKFHAWQRCLSTNTMTDSYTSEEHLVLFPIRYSEVCINVIEDTDYNVQTYDSSKLL